MKREYLSCSALKAFATSPNHYIQYVRGTKVATPAMIFGSALHCHVLEPDEFEKRYAVAPQVDRRTKEGKLLFAEFAEKAEGKEVLTAQDYAQILDMDLASMNERTAHDLIVGCHRYEKLKEGEINGVRFKGIADGLAKGYILDIKTCQDASPEAFERTAYNSFYHEQAAAYRILFGKDRFYWVAMEKNAPHNVSVYMQSEEAFLMARHRLMRLIDAWKEWDGKPRSYSNEVLMLNLPRWANKIQ